VIPTRNRRHFLKQAVESVREQNFLDWELIVVDDASEDDTQTYLTEIADGKIRTIRGLSA